MDIKKLVDEMSIEDLCGQVLCYDIQKNDTPEETYEIIRHIRPGGLFVLGIPDRDKEVLKKKFEQDKLYQKFATEVTGYPTIICTDIEHGPGSYCQGLPVLPNPLAWGACNDVDLIERAGELTGRIARKCGIQYTLGPVVDLDINFRNALIVSRSISDDPDRVIRIAGAYARGVQKNGYLMATLKHFPG
ncbi:MAG: glycoside hydrolase family 3 protein, partial [Clostridia bacterium]|nr:glycoside hydrolase family 3 protein [Clostridia bacterium]